MRHDEVNAVRQELMCETGCAVQEGGQWVRCAWEGARSRRAADAVAAAPHRRGAVWVGAAGSSGPG